MSCEIQGRPSGDQRSGVACTGVTGECAPEIGREKTLVGRCEIDGLTKVREVGERIVRIAQTTRRPEAARQAAYQAGLRRKLGLFTAQDDDPEMAN